MSQIKPVPFNRKFTRCRFCMRLHQGKCDPALVRTVREQRRRAAAKQGKLLKLCRDYLRAVYPRVYERLKKECGL